VLLVTHYADEAERLCDRVAFIRAGRVAAIGSPKDLIEAAGRQNLDDAIVALTSQETAAAGELS
jgi:ABC-2 type transport system ATP-binding protein